MQAPLRPLKAGSIFDVANRRFVSLGIEAAHHGGHALRHACAVRLLAEGLTLKEIGDHLGHRSTSATSTYAKVNMAALRQVGCLRLGGSPMMLADVIDAYLTRQRSLGMRFDSAGQLLHRFGRAMGDRPIGEVTPGAILDFLNGNGALTATWTLKHRVLTGLYRFAVSRGYVDNSPLPTTLPKLPPQQTPYIYSTDELRRLLEATAILRNGHSRQVPAMYRTLLLLLYGTGMRIGEALRLTLQDVDLAERIITVRRAKFFKTRLVPIGPKLADELAAHLERRGLLPMPPGKAAPLFASRGIRGWSYPRVIVMFQHVRRAAGIDCPVGEPRPPRLHDLRHTAAVHRVVAWYRTGQDAQRLLPQLATYLGHLDIRSTQRYLQMTPELLHAASQRFAQYAMGGDHEG